MSVLRFGTDSTLRLEVPAAAQWIHCDAPRGEPLADLGQAVDRALAEPLEFPPLAQTALPGDRVVLALEHAVPRAATIIAHAVAALLAAGVEANDITLVSTLADAGGADPLAELPPDVRRSVSTAVHDPACRDTLSYFGASATAKPIYVNRAIHDADLVISIGCLRLDESLGYFGISAGVFPSFSDTASLGRYRSSKSADASRRQRLKRQADEVSWMLGVRFTIQVVPGAGDEVLHVLAGDLDAVRREGAACATRPGATKCPAAPAWSWRRFEATPANKPGRTWAARWRRPPGWPARTARWRSARS